MLTISELARYAGVTTRTIRHYEQLGLMPRPVRDELDHRRYGADALVLLRRITTLTEAGVPLRQVADVLAAPPDEQSRLLADVDRQLRERQRSLREARSRLDALRRGEDASLPAAAQKLVDRLVELGAPAHHIDAEREAWLLTGLLWPDLNEGWLAQQLALFDDPEYAQLYLDVMQLDDLDADDPLVEQLAERNVAWTLQHLDGYSKWIEGWSGDAVAAQVLQDHTRRRWSSPSFTRMQQLVTEKLSAALATR